MMLWKVIEAHALSWNLNRIEVRCDMKLGEGARIKTATGTMPSGWEIARKLYIEEGGKYRELHIRFAGTRSQRKRWLRLWVKKGLYADVPALADKYGKGK